MSEKFFILKDAILLTITQCNTILTRELWSQPNNCWRICVWNIPVNGWIVHHLMLLMMRILISQNQNCLPKETVNWLICLNVKWFKIHPNSNYHKRRHVLQNQFLDNQSRKSTTSLHNSNGRSINVSRTSTPVRASTGSLSKRKSWYWILIYYIKIVFIT